VLERRASQLSKSEQDKEKHLESRFKNLSPELIRKLSHEDYKEYKEYLKIKTQKHQGHYKSPSPSRHQDKNKENEKMGHEHKDEHKEDKESKTKDDEVEGEKGDAILDEKGENDKDDKPFRHDDYYKRASKENKKSGSASRSRSRSASRRRRHAQEGDVVVKGRGFDNRRGYGGTMRGWDNDDYTAVNSKLKEIDSRIKRTTRNAAIRQERAIEQQKRQTNGNDKSRGLEIDNRNSIRNRLKKRNERGDKWSHDKFEKVLRSASPTNEKFQPRDSPDYGNIGLPAEEEVA